MIATDPRPMFSAPVDGTPVRLFVFTGWSSHHFGPKNAAGKCLGEGTIVWAGTYSTTT
jgi:hypothetical protein